MVCYTDTLLELNPLYLNCLLSHRILTSNSSMVKNLARTVKCGTVIGKEVFYPYTSSFYEPKIVDDYLKFGSGNYPPSTRIGILGRTPLTDIIILPSMIPKDYMHLVAGGHMKWLLGRWDNMFACDVFEAGSEYLSTIILPHSFKYQPWPLFQYSSWKPKFFREFLLYIAPVFAVLFIPDCYAADFILYFLYVRPLHYFRDKSSLVGIDLLFNQYLEAIESLYGLCTSLCSLHMHQHLLEQVEQHGSLSMTNCFARESFLGSSIKLCHGTRYILQQLVT